MSEILDVNQVLEERFEEEDTAKDLYLTFEIDEKDYGVEVSKIKEIITMCAVTNLPQTPEYVRGIINLRGDIVPVINVRARFAVPEPDYVDSTCIVVLDLEDYIIGLIVDQVKGVFTITEENLSSPPDAKLSYDNQFIKSIGKTEDGIKMILDIEKVLF